MAWTKQLRLAKAFSATAAATTAIGTSNTNITGLSANLALGTYLIQAEVALVNVGTPTETDFLFGAGGGLVVSNMNLSLIRRTATAASVSSITALNTAGGSNLSLVIQASIFGTFTVTTAGTLGLQGIRVSGTSVTSQVGSYLLFTPIG